MDWTGDEFQLTSNDLGLFDYGEGESVVLQKSEPFKEFVRTSINVADDWDEWLKNVVDPEEDFAKALEDLCIRAQNLSDDEASPVSYLPFTKSNFEKITHRCRIHRTIARTITRGSSYFSSAKIQDPHAEEPSIVMTYRTTSIWARDLALALTHYPSSNKTTAMIFGCDLSHQRQIEGRLSTIKSQTSLSNPMLLPGILAELERKRLTGFVEDTIDHFTLRAGGNMPPTTTLEEEHGVRNAHISEKRMEEYLASCYESQSLAAELKHAKRQLVRMIQACDELDTPPVVKNTREVNNQKSNLTSCVVMSMGMRVKQRMLEIIDEYDNKVDECGMVLESMSITMQTIWNHIARHDTVINTRISKTNSLIALDSKHDSSQMRSIALLTMIYLPVSAVASIFSTTIFDLSPSNGNLVSKYIWVFVVLSFGLTAATVLAWYVATHREKMKDALAYDELRTGSGAAEGEGATRIPAASRLAEWSRKVSYQV